MGMLKNWTNQGRLSQEHRNSVIDHIAHRFAAKQYVTRITVSIDAYHRINQGNDHWRARSDARKRHIERIKLVA